MARQFALANSDIAFNASFPLAGTADWFISSFLYRTSNAETNGIAFEYSPSSAGFDLVCNTPLNGGGTDQVRSYGPVNQWADTYVAPAAGAWHHYVWVIAGDGPPSPNSINIVYIDGVLQTLTTVGHTYPFPGPAGSDMYSHMGRRIAPTNSRFLSGRLAEWAMWSSPTMRANPAPYVKQLAAGCCPLTVNRREMLMYLPYFGVDSPEGDVHGAQRNFTLNGSSTRVNHPPKARSLVNLQY